MKSKLAYAYGDLGMQLMHNIPEPVHAYQMQLNATVTIPQRNLPLPDKPSIAVLPFENMSGDREQEYFADGLRGSSKRCNRRPPR